MTCIEHEWKILWIETLAKYQPRRDRESERKTQGEKEKRTHLFDKNHILRWRIMKSGKKKFDKVPIWFHLDGWNWIPCVFCQTWTWEHPTAKIHRKINYKRCRSFFLFFRCCCCLPFFFFFFLSLLFFRVNFILPFKCRSVMDGTRVAAAVRWFAMLYIFA